MRVLFTLVILVSLASCEVDVPLTEPDSQKVQLSLPAWFPIMPLPDDGELTAAKVALGRRLFYDPILSGDSTISCASCHTQAMAFADGEPLSAGVHSLLTMRNSPTLANLAWQPYMFMDGGVMTMEIQVEGPLFAHNEMDFTFFEANQRLRAQPTYIQQFASVFSREPDAYGITRAIAAFERTMVSGKSRFDRFYYQGDSIALSTEERRGWQLFSGSAGCTGCHALPFFTDFSFRNIGLYQAYADSGRARVTRISTDNGKFKVPTLRNVAATAPYMHDGSLPDLDAVVEHFATGIEPHTNLDPVVQNLNLTAQEKSDLVAFLRSLTDEEFLIRNGLGRL